MSGKDTQAQVASPLNPLGQVAESWCVSIEDQETCSLARRSERALAQLFVYIKGQGICFLVLLSAPVAVLSAALADGQPVV
jgi:hypothetical protein